MNSGMMHTEAPEVSQAILHACQEFVRSPFCCHVWCHSFSNHNWYSLYIPSKLQFNSRHTGFNSMTISGSFLEIGSNWLICVLHLVINLGEDNAFFQASILFGRRLISWCGVTQAKLRSHSFPGISQRKLFRSIRSPYAWLCFVLTILAER